MIDPCDNSCPSTDSPCDFTDPFTRDPGQPYSPPVTTNCERPSGLVIGDDSSIVWDEDGNPSFV